jgi:hypothetical protein
VTKDDYIDLLFMLAGLLSYVFILLFALYELEGR